MEKSWWWYRSPQGWKLECNFTCLPQEERKFAGPSQVLNFFNRGNFNFLLTREAFGVIYITSVFVQSKTEIMHGGVVEQGLSFGWSLKLAPWKFLCLMEWMCVYVVSLGSLCLIDTVVSVRMMMEIWSVVKTELCIKSKSWQNVQLWLSCVSHDLKLS